jgi:hypothetical protein
MGALRRNSESILALRHRLFQTAREPTGTFPHSYDLMRDLGDKRDAFYPFQGHVSRASPMPCVVGMLVVAILAVISVNIASVVDTDLLEDSKQITTAGRAAAGNSATFN